MKSTLISLAALATLLAIGILVLTRPPGNSEETREEPVVIIPSPSPGEGDSERLSGAEGVGSREETAPAATPGAREGVEESGALELTFVDAVTGEGLPGLGFVLYGDSSRQLFQEGQSDDEGRARLDGLPSDEVLVGRTRRRPPHSRASFTVRIEPGELSRRVVEVDAGGSLIGQLVDAEGRGIPGFEVVVETRYPGMRRPPEWEGIPTEAMTTTDVDGHWRIDHLSDPASGSSVETEVDPPQRADEAHLLLRDPIHPDWCALPVKARVFEGQVTDTGQQVYTVVPIRGRVVDEGGTPLPGVLVTAYPPRLPIAGRAHQSPPVSPDDEFWSTGADRLPTDVFTDGQGRFQLDVPERCSEYFSLATWLPESRVERFHFRAADLEGDLLLEFPLAQILTVRFVDSQGRTLTVRPDDQGERSIAPFPHRRRAGTGALLLGLAEAGRTHVSLAEGPDGLYRGTCPAPLASVRSVDVLLSGYLPLLEEYPAGLDSPRLEFVLTPVHQLHVSLHIAEQDDVQEATRWEVGTAPGSWTGAEIVPERDTSTSFDFLSAQGPTKITFDLLTGEPRWVVLLGMQGRLPRYDPIVRGPLAPGPEEHVVEISRANLVPVESDPETADNAPGFVRYRLRLEVIDEDGLPVPACKLTLDSDGADRPLSGQWDPETREGLLHAFQTKGTLQGALTVQAKGYGRVRLEGIVVDAEEVADVGTVTLPTAHVFQGRLTDLEGRVVAGRSLSARTPVLEVLRMHGPVGTDQDGRFEITGPPERFLVVVEEAQDGGEPKSSYALVEAWAPGEEHALQLSRLPEVQIVIELARAIDRYAWVQLLAWEAGSDRSSGSPWRSELYEPDVLARRFQLELPPGRYRFSAHPWIDAHDLEVLDQDEVQELRLKAPR